MKTLRYILFLFAPFLASAQQPTSNLVDSLIVACKDHVANSEYEQALETISTAEELALKLSEKPSGLYASTCFNHAKIFHYQGEYEAAKIWYEKALSIWEELGDETIIDYASNLNNLALIHYEFANFKKSETYFIKALKIKENISGKSNANFANSVDNLANLYSEMGEYEKAEPLYLEAKSIRESVLGKNHPDYAISLNNLAVLYMETARFENVEPLYFEAKSIWEKASKTKTPDYADCLNNLGNLYWSLGVFDKAETYYLSAKMLRESLLGKSHSSYVQSLNNIASLYLNIGDYDKAENMYLEALNLRKEAFGENHPDYVVSLDNLAVLYSRTHEFKKAESFFLKTLDIRKNLLGTDNLDYAASLRNLSSLYQKMGNREKAKTLTLQNLDIVDKILGKECPDYALALQNLATCYRDLNNYSEAEPVYLEANTIFEKNYGKANAYRLSNLADLANMYVLKGDYKQAEPIYAEVASLRQAQLEKAIHYLSEQELNKYKRLFSEDQAHLLSFAQNIHSIGSPISSACYDNSLFYKGFLLQAANQVRHLAMSDSSSTAQLNLLKSYERRLSDQYTLPAEERHGVEDLEAKANDLEKDIARSVSNFGEAMQQVKWLEVQQKLKPGEAAIEFVQYQYFGKKQTDSTMYAALLLKPGMKQPQFVPLFEEKSLDSLLHTQGQRKADYVNSLYAVAERGAKPLNKPEKSLYEMLWQPLEQSTHTSRGVEDLLDGVQTVYFSPVGLLHRLNIGAIPISDEETVADRYNLVELGSTRQLAMPSETILANRNAILFGGIKYEAESLAMQEERDGYSDKFELKRGQITTSIIDSTLRGGSWNYLKWTEREVAALTPILDASAFQTTTLRGEDATESAFKAIGSSGASPRVLHIATHGFFFPDPPPQLTKIGANPNAISGIGVMDDSEPVFKMSEHPMIRSGLILAGGNFAWENGRPVEPGMEDGILTAYEISQMNLTNTELVVLSACETGLGDIQGNEGVYGLQRAFKIAGAKYLIMSLWQIPDFQTQELMTTFYTIWLTEKMTIPNAFRAAQKEMREKYQNPFFWAGFVLVE